MVPLYVFDLDGTLALRDHRLPILKSGTSDRWDRFYDACDKDVPNHCVIATMEMLKGSGAEIRIFSGRSEQVREKTVAWMCCNTSFRASQLGKQTLVMRPKQDYTPDDQLKHRWYRDMHYEDRRRLIAVFDDRDKVVRMWRSIGITCFQVAPGEF